MQENTPQLSDKGDSILVLRFGELLYLVTQVFNFFYWTSFRYPFISDVSLIDAKFKNCQSVPLPFWYLINCGYRLHSLKCFLIKSGSPCSSSNIQRTLFSWSPTKIFASNWLKLIEVQFLRITWSFSMPTKTSLVVIKYSMEIAVFETNAISGFFALWATFPPPPTTKQTNNELSEDQDRL